MSGTSTVDASGSELLSVASVIVGGSGNDNLVGGDGNDTLDGAAGNDQVSGGAGDDVLLGGAGNDTMYGGTGSDTYEGGAGNDWMLDYGSTGDIYRYNLGDGTDLMSDVGGVDVVQLGAGITAATTTVTGSWGDLTLLFADGGSLKLLLQYDFDTGLARAEYPIEQVVFADGTVWDHATLRSLAGLDAEIWGTSGNDLLTGTAQADRLNGGAGNDVLAGGAGADVLNGGEGSDTLDGGTGNDELWDRSSISDDTYVYRLGDGYDRLSDLGGTDTVQLGSGITAASVVARNVNGYLELRFADGGGLTLSGQYTSTGTAIATFQIERIVLEDGTVWDQAQLRALAVTGGSGADALYGFVGADAMSGGAGNDGLYGQAGNDTLSAGTGNDMLDGGDGDDSLWGEAGDDRLVGGTGSDLLAGGEGNDTYEAGSGSDTLTDESTSSADTYRYNLGDGTDAVSDRGGADKVQLGSGLTAAATSVSRSDAGDLVLIFSDGGSLRLTGQYGSDGSAQAGAQIEQIVFADGTVWDQAQLRARTLAGTGGADSLYGFDTADTLDGGAGNDALHGLAGNDFLSGGVGDDTLSGGTGDDTYRYGLGDGADVLVEAGGADTLELGGGLTSSGTTVRVSAGDLVLGFADGGSLTLRQQIDTSTGVALLPGQVERVVFADGTVWDQEQLRTLAGQVQTSGGNGDDALTGAEGGDRLVGHGGNDYLFGAGGSDMLEGGDDDDTLMGGAGRDWLYGGAGNDMLLDDEGDGTLDGGDGDDWIEAGNGSDVLIGGAGADYLAGNEGADTLNGGDGDDALYGGNGVDRLAGGAGNDVLVDDEGGGTLDGGAGHDVLVGGVGDDTYAGGTGDDTLNDYGSSTDTYVYNLGDGTDDLFDGGGADTVQLGGGATAANVTVRRTEAGDLVLGFTDGGSLRLSGQYNSSGSAQAGFQIERVLFQDGTAWDPVRLRALAVTGSSGADTLYGFDGSDTMTGGSGDDRLFGGTGDDSLDGGAGADVLEGGAGTDRLTGGAGNDVLRDLEGNSTLDGGAGDDSLLSGAGADQLVGGDGNDLLSSAQGNDSLYGGEGADTYDAGAGNDTLADFSIASGDSYRYRLGDGVDTLSDNGGVDTLLLGGGITADTTTVRRNSFGHMVLSFSDGGMLTLHNQYDATTGAARLEYHIEQIVFDDGTTWDQARLRALATPAGTAAEDVIYGFDGNDSLTGAAGNDSLGGSGGNDSLDGGEGNDILDGGVGDDLMLGRAGTDTLYGGTGNDVYLGGLGFDYLLDQAVSDDRYDYNLGDGLDYVSDGGGTDAVRLGAGITAGATTVTTNWGQILLRFADGGSLTLDSQYDIDTGVVKANQMEQVVFADGTVWDPQILWAKSGLDKAIWGTSGNDTLSGGADADRLSGGAGDDFLSGGAGADTLSGGEGGDTLGGGLGNDELWDRSMTSSDLYRYNLGDGQDVVYDLGGVDSIQLGSGINAASVTVRNVGNNMVLGFADGGSLQGVGQYGGNGTTPSIFQIESVVFADGTVWDQAQMRALAVNGGNGNDVLYGFGTNDAMTGGGGADLLYGYAGNDTLDGGAGNDTLDGGVGNDTYLMARGGGADTIIDNDSTTGNADLLSMGPDVRADQLWFRQVGTSLEISIIGTADKTTISNWYAASAYHVEQFRTADGKALLDSQVNALVSAMAAFAPPPAGQTTLPDAYQASLNAVIAANWV